jgi:uncharacterized repeat protein (TIGR03803 family)
MYPRYSCAPILATMIFTLALAASALGATAEQVLHAFLGKPAAYSLSALIFDKQGNLYGTASQGGPSNAGVAFELSPKSGGGWSYNVLYRFKGGKDGASPIGALVQDGTGNLYGVTYSGGGSGACSGGCGTVFELSPSSGGWKETVLYSFDGNSGAEPEAGLVMDSAGNLYGTTVAGGSTTCGGGCGTVYELASTNGGWSEHVLTTFSDGKEGSFPRGKLVFDAAGNLYGTTQNVHDYYGYGLVFELMPSGSGWKEVVLHTFSEENDGNTPIGELTFDAAGNLYGTTEEGGFNDRGTVFEMMPSSGGWTERVIHRFHNGSDGFSVLAGLVVDAAGNLYGATDGGGAGGYGVIFKMTPGSGDWTLTPLYSFHGKSDGGNTVVSVTLDSAGNLYGTTLGYGKYGYGVVFEVAP